jgi:AcrR family transcriptional regulator
VPAVSSRPEPALSLRERNKRKRRDAILDAALRLLGQSPNRQVTTEQIAELAEVSPATVYNLVGTREQLLLALVDRVLHDMVATLAAQPPADPVQMATFVVAESAERFIADGVAFRQVVTSIGDFAASRLTIAFDPAQLQVAAMRAAQEQGIVRGDLDPAALGRQIYLSYNGALFAWGAGVLSDDGLRAAVRHGLTMVLAAAATDAHRPRFLSELTTLGEQLGVAGWGV